MLKIKYGIVSYKNLICDMNNKNLTHYSDKTPHFQFLTFFVVRDFFVTSVILYQLTSKGMTDFLI